MSSKVLYPPIVDSYMSAFTVDNPCRIFFRLSKFNGSQDFNSVHVSIVKQDTGMNVVKTTDSNGRYRSTGIILDVSAIPVEGESNLYYIEIPNDDLSSEYNDYSGSLYKGWIPSWIYKVQIRLSSVLYSNNTQIGQAAWLNKNAQNFSEWSTICIVKATGKIDYIIGKPLDIDTTNQNSDPLSKTRILYTTTLDLSGSFIRKVDPSELIKTYRFILYNENNDIIEDTGEIYVNQYQDSDSFNYIMKTELRNDANYELAFIFTTVNGYKNGFYKFDDSKDERCKIQCTMITTNLPECTLLTADNDAEGILSDITSVDKEEDEGRIGLKLYSDNFSIISGNYCIRRADSRDNFQTWKDIRIYVCKQEAFVDTPIIYDYTVESGVWYKYGVQKVETNGDRSALFVIPSPIIRNFNYSFLLGPNNKQLRLQFNNTISNFKYQIADSKVDPIGSKYTSITRNATTYYRTFSMNALISFWMDEDHLFTSKKEIYKIPKQKSSHSEDSIVDLYYEHNLQKGIMQYDHTYERDFRNEVLEFLQNGEVKLFKSPTEGNILVRLTDVNCTPAIGDRMLYNVTANVNEIDEATLEKYLEYNLYEVGEYATSFATRELRIGQLSMDFKSGTNIIEEIYKKYDSLGQNIAGYTHKIKSISNLRITFEDKPLRVLNSSNGFVIGYNLYYDGRLITVSGIKNIYEFDERITFTDANTLKILGPADEEKLKQDAEARGETDWVFKIKATVDFLYDIETDVYVGKRILTREYRNNLSQFYQECIPNENIYKELRYKHYIEWPSVYKRLFALTTAEIEANPGACFAIADDQDGHISQPHVVGITGQLYFSELENIQDITYLGMIDKNGNIQPVNTDVLINYYYIIQEGSYESEEVTKDG